MRDVTLQSVQALTERICLMDYCCDYNLPGMLAAGETTLLGMSRFLQKQVHDPRVLLNPLHGHGGCSTFKTLTPEGKVIMGRNFDFLDSGCVVLWTHPSDGYRSLAMVDQTLLLYRDVRKARRPLRLLGAPYASMDGVNEAGLSCAVLELMTKPTRQRTGKTPIGTNVAVRGILDTCATTDEAVRFLERYDMYDMLNACYHYQITDARGESVIVEYMNDVMHVYRADGPEDPFYLTNFFLTPGGDNSRELGRDRYRHIQCALNDSPIIDEPSAMKLLSESTMRFRWRGLLISTLWSAVYNLTDRTLLLSAGCDYSRQYRFSLDKPLVAEPVAGFDAHITDKKPIAISSFKDRGYL